MGLDCLLISTNQVMTPYPVYPLGAAHLVGALREAGHQAVHFDLLAQGGFAGLAARLVEEPPDVIGLSIRNLDTVDSNDPASFVTGAVETMRCIRGITSVPVVLGGPAFSILPEEMLALLAADYGVVGEGEILLPRLVDAIAQGRPPAERILRSTPDDSPWRPVCYDKTTAAHYLEWGGMLNIQTKRGCPNRCTYCSYPALEGSRVRLRDPEAVAADVMRVSRDYGARYIFFADAVFNDGQGHYLEVAEALIRAGNTTPWCAFFRPQHLSREGLELCKRAGLSAMELGTDAASDATLAAMGKGFTFADVRQSNDLAAAAGIPCAHFIIFGGPDEDMATLEEGIANVDSLEHCVVFGFSGIRVLPDTGMYDRALAEGVITKEQPLLEPLFYFSPTMSQQALDRRLREAWTGRFDRVYPAAVMQDRISRLHQRGHVGPMWDLLVRRR